MGARHRRRRLLPLAAALALTTGCGATAPDSPGPGGTSTPGLTGASTSDTSTTSGPAPGPASSTPARAMVGVFRGTDRAKVAAFETWLGRPLDAVVDFPARDTWAQIEDPGYLLEHWRGAPYRLVISIPTRPRTGGATDAAGARGDYDRHFAALGRALVRHGRADAMIRVGWEFNLTVSDSFSHDPATFRAYFRRIVAALRSAPGQNFHIIWNPGNGHQPSPHDAGLFYPGDDVVDSIGLDVYDSAFSPKGYPLPHQCAAQCVSARVDHTWNEFIYGGPRGLKYWADFARMHGKPMTLPEWGLWGGTRYPGGNDNPTFIERMNAFIHDPANRVIMHAYFEWDNPEDRHSLLGSFPRSADVFRRSWGEIR